MNHSSSRVLLLITTLVATMPGVVGAKQLAVYPPWDPGHPKGGNPYTTIAAGLEALAPGDILEIMPGIYNHDVNAPYVEDVVLDKAGIRLQSDPGVIIEGTVRVNAPGVTLRSLTIIHDRACIIVGPNASDCTIEMCRVVTRTREGVAIEIVGPGASGVTIVNSNIYTSGGENPSVDPRSLKHDWKPWARADVGIRIHGDATNGGAWIHHNTVASYETALSLGDEASGRMVPGIRLWKNRITANTIGLHLFGADCVVEDNTFARNTGTGVVVRGRGNRLLGNRILDNAEHGVVAGRADVLNNVVAGNRGGAVKITGPARVLHNTFHANGGTLLAIETAGDAPETATEFANNLVDHDGALLVDVPVDARHHNVYANHAAPSGFGDGSRSGVVAFRDVARRDYRPELDGIAVDAAVAMAGVTLDATSSGRRIGVAPDAGAFEIGPKQATGGERWIAPDGSDESGDGTAGKPFATVTKATEGAGPDDIVYLKAGTYKTEGQITCAGAEGHPVKIMPAPDLPRAADRVRSFVPRKPLELAPAPAGTAVVEGARWILTDAAHVLIEGIEFRDAHGAVTFADRAAHNVVRKCLFINCPTSFRRILAGALRILNWHDDQWLIGLTASIIGLSFKHNDSSWSRPVSRCSRWRPVTRCASTSTASRWPAPSNGESSCTPANWSWWSAGGGMHDGPRIHGRVFPVPWRSAAAAAVVR